MGSFVRLVDDNQIPLRLKGGVILIELTADGLGAAQVLHRGKVNELPAVTEQIFKRTAFVAVNVIGAAENLVEVVVPARVDYGAMRDDNRLVKAHAADDLQGAKRLTKSHLSIPEKIFAALLEVFDGFIYGGLLFGAENYIFANTLNRNELLALLDGGDSFNGVLQIDFEPLATFGTFGGVSILLQQAMNVIIAEGAPVVRHRKFKMQEIVINASRPRVLVNAFFGEAFQILFGRRKVLYRRLSDFQKPLVRGVRNSKDINQSALINFIRIHRRPPLSSSINSKVLPVLQSLIRQYTPPKRFGLSAKGGEPVSPSI